MKKLSASSVFDFKRSSVCSPTLQHVFANAPACVGKRTQSYFSLGTFVWRWSKVVNVACIGNI